MGLDPTPRLELQSPYGLPPFQPDQTHTPQPTGLSTQVRTIPTEHILATHSGTDPGQPALKDGYLVKLAQALFRMEVLFPEDVEVTLAAVPASPQLRRHRAHMHAMTPRENVGVWASQRAQVFFLYAMNRPYWRRFFADVLESLVRGPSVAATMRYTIRRFLDALRQQDG